MIVNVETEKQQPKSMTYDQVIENLDIGELLEYDDSSGMDRIIGSAITIVDNEDSMFILSLNTCIFLRKEDRLWFRRMSTDKRVVLQQEGNLE